MAGLIERIFCRIMGGHDMRPEWTYRGGIHDFCQRCRWERW